MDERRVARRAARSRCPVGSTARSPGAEHDVDGGHDVGAGVAGQRVRRQRHVGSRRWTSTCGRRSVGASLPLRSLTGGTLPSHVVTLGRRACAASTPSAPRAGVAYRESLRTPWWWYPSGWSWRGLLAAEFHIAGYALTDWIPFGILLPLSVVIVWSLGRGTARDRRAASCGCAARTCRCETSAASSRSTRATLRRVVGREGDPAAFVSIRPWIGPGVQFWLDDPDDPTPYWVVSTPASRPSRSQRSAAAGSEVLARVTARAERARIGSTGRSRWSPAPAAGIGLAIAAAASSRRAAAW